MKKILIGLVIAAVVLGGGFYYWWTLPPAQSSTPIVATHLESTPTPLARIISTPGVAVVSPTPAGGPNATPGPSAPVQPASAAERKYEISQPGSSAEFHIDEVLRGTPVTVIGKTAKVAGEVALNVNDLSTVRIGEIKVDARDLQTDNNNRNNIIHRRILETDTYQYVIFKPIKVTGLAGPAKAGSSQSFQMSGDLTIRSVTLPANFTGELSVAGPDSITGKALTKVKKADFQLQVPSVPFVANVGEDVTLQIDFVLKPIAP